MAWHPNMEIMKMTRIALFASFHSLRGSEGEDEVVGMVMRENGKLLVGCGAHDLIPLSSISRPLIPHPITVGSILSAALVEQDDNASFVDTDRLSSLPNDCACFKMNHQSDHA